MDFMNDGLYFQCERAQGSWKLVEMKLLFIVDQIHPKYAIVVDY